MVKLIDLIKKKEKGKNVKINQNGQMTNFGSIKLHYKYIEFVT